MVADTVDTVAALCAEDNSGGWWNSVCHLLHHARRTLDAQSAAKGMMLQASP